MNRKLVYYFFLSKSIQNSCIRKTLRKSAFYPTNYEPNINYHIKTIFSVL